MLNIGCHLSVSKGYANMGNEAMSIGANTFQFFTRNPRGGSFKALDLKDIQQLNQITETNAFAPLLAHAPYTMNPCAAEDRVLQFAMQAMQEDLERLEHLHNVYYNFHPGSHVGQGAEVGIKKIIAQLNAIIKPNQKTKVLLETMAGKGTEVGRSFEELAQIIRGVNEIQHIGVCLDTCHIYDAGYDWVNGLDEVLERFDAIIGLEKLYAVHMNDSKNPFGSAKDRHECIGKGSIGLDAFERFINHPKLKHLPFYLETPNELPGYESEIKLLKSLYRE